MSTPPLGPLQLSREQVRTAADFHEAYGQLVLREAETPPKGVESDATGRTRPDVLVEAASAYRLAGQWRLLIDPPRARDVLLTAARLLTRAELTFGAFLEASLVPDQVTGRTRERWMTRLLREGGPTSGTGDPLDYAQQQTYLLLACAALSRRGSEEAAALTYFATRSPHRVGVVPVGSLSMPVRMFWNLALYLLRADAPDGERADQSSARAYFGTLAELSGAYARTVDLAMANELTWFNAAAPIDVADLDLIGTTAMAVRRFGPITMDRLLRDVSPDLSAVARVPLDLGMELASPPPPQVPPVGPGPVTL